MSNTTTTRSERKVQQPTIVPPSSATTTTKINPPRADQGAIGESKVPNYTDEQVSEFITQLYATDWSDEDLASIYEVVRYKGFDRKIVVKQLMSLGLSKRLMMELILVCCLQGPQRAARTKLSNGKTPNEMNIPASGGQGKLIITCNKIAAATADLAAYYMKKLDVPKRLNIDLPAWLQFPSAASIKLPQRIRDQHYIFAQSFSTIIGGVFNEQIYMQMVANAYLDDKLKLFDV